MSPKIAFAYNYCLARLGLEPVRVAFSRSFERKMDSLLVPVRNRTGTAEEQTPYESDSGWDGIIVRRLPPI